MTFPNDPFSKLLSPVPASMGAIDLNVLVIKGGMLATVDKAVPINLEGKILPRSFGLFIS